MKKIYWIGLFALLLLAVPIAALAQDQTGSISGTVYRDINANGVCVNEGEPRVAANIPLEVVSDDVGELIRITSNADGTFSYTTDAQGLWRVTVVPGQGWRVTSQQTLEVVLSADNPLTENLNFCIIEVQQTGGGGGTTLPESGVAIAPPLLLAAAFGFLFIAAGAILLLIGRPR